MQDKLLLYGFEQWQIDILVKHRNLATSHGIYIMNGSRLYLKQGRHEKEIKL